MWVVTKPMKVKVKLMTTDYRDLAEKMYDRTIPLCTEKGRQLAEFFKDRVENNNDRYYISIETFLPLLDQTEEQPKETDALLVTHCVRSTLALGNFADVVMPDKRRFHLFISKAMHMRASGLIFVDEYDLEALLIKNPKNITDIWK